MDPLAVTVSEAAGMLGISESMLWQILAVGKVSKVKIGRRTVIRVSELERFLEEASVADPSVNAAPHRKTSNPVNTLTGETT